MRVTGGKIRTVTMSPAKAATVKVAIRLKAAQVKVLRKKGRLPVVVRLRFVSDGGATTSTNTAVVLVRKKK